MVHRVIYNTAFDGRGSITFSDGPTDTDDALAAKDYFLAKIRELTLEGSRGSLSLQRGITIISEFTYSEVPLTKQEREEG